MKHTFYILIAGLLLASCREASVPTPAIYLRGGIEGRVHLMSLDTLFRSNAGVRVSIEGTSKAAVTDDNGYWRIDGLTTGSYTLRFERDSFGYIRLFNFQFVGGGVADVPDQRMYQMAWGSLGLEPVVVSEFGFSGQVLAPPNTTAQIREVVEFDQDSALLRTRPEYASLILVSVRDSHPEPGDTLELGYFRSDTLVLSVFPSAKTGKPLYARVGMITSGNVYYGVTSFYDPYERRMITSGVGGQSNIVRVTIK